MEHIKSYKEFINESNKEPKFANGDQVIIQNVYGPDGKKYNDKEGIVSGNAMKYSNGSYSYTVRIGRKEIEFRETELKKK